MSIAAGRNVAEVSGFDRSDWTTIAAIGGTRSEC